MATLHLPRNRPPRKIVRPEDKPDRHLAEGLKQTHPDSDPVAATAPGAARPVGPTPAAQKKSGER